MLGLFNSGSKARASRTPAGVRDSVLSMDPKQLVNQQRQRLTAVRMESGYYRDDFERLVAPLVDRVAEYVHLLPASRNENHSEPGGLFRLAVETACLAFRRADGKFLCGPFSTDVQKRERDRVWRYATFVAGLCRPLGRAAVHLKVIADSGETWNAYDEPLWTWIKRANVSSMNIEWRDRSDARPSDEATVWVASRIISAPSLSYLRPSQDELMEILLDCWSKRASGNRVIELVESAFAAAIDQDLRHRSEQNTDHAAVNLQHRLLEALRSLAREKWTINSAGARLWHTTSGTFVVWKPAVMDLLVKLKGLGVTGAPSDPDTLAEILVSQGVLSNNPLTSKGLRHYYKIAPEVRGVPKHALEVVRLADPALILSLDGIEAAELSNTEKESPQLPLGRLLPEEPRPPVLAEQPANRADARDVLPTVTEPRRAEVPTPVPVVQDVVPAPPDLSGLDRYGSVAGVLRELILRSRSGESGRLFHKHPQGFAIAFPAGFSGACENPRNFLQDLEAQSLVVIDPQTGRRTYRSKPGANSLPEQYVVLSGRLAPFIGECD